MGDCGWWDSCAPGRARAGDRRERPDRVRGGLGRVGSAILLVHVLGLRCKQTPGSACSASKATPLLAN